MSAALKAQMAWVDRLIRHPAELSEAKDFPELSGTIEAARLKAVHRSTVGLIVSRWWQARFPAVLATLCHHRPEATSQLVQHPSFEDALGEDLDGRAFVAAVQALTDPKAAAEGAELPPWLGELLAYEYLLSTGLPRRGRGDSLHEATEEALLSPDAVWLSGGRLTRPLLVYPFTWPVAELQEEPGELEPDPHTRLLCVTKEEVLDAAPPQVAADVAELLAQGASGATIEASDPDAAEALEWFFAEGLARPE